VDREEVSKMLQRVLQGAPFSMREWAEAAEVSYPAFRSWAYGRRIPSRDKVQKLAEALRDRASKLQELAAELEGAAGEE
jgi:hypothetical protein